MFEQLKIILDKDPIISTFGAKDLMASPETVDDYYSKIAKTHMSLGDTKKYEESIFACLVKNKTTFNGAVVGEFGFGKTSILIHLWKRCEENNILAVPPYQWEKFHEHFQTIYHWVAYKIRKHDKNLSIVLSKIYEKYKNQTIENEAKKLTEKTKITYENALEIVNLQVETGKLSIEFTPNDLLTFCEEVTSLLQEKTGFKGLLVITDELQQTMTDLNPKTVFDYLFNITNPLCQATGDYGFLWGFPEKTFADLNRERSDIIDRLNSNKTFIRLSNIYDNKFALDLWSSYAHAFDFQSLKYEIVDEHTLIAIGQVCDGDRRDLGNGPRSVISAFNSIIYHYKIEKKKYTVVDFVENCIEGEIILGGASEYAKKINKILNIDMVGKKYENTIKIMAAFPEGIPESTIDEYNIREEINQLIQDSGGLGKIVIKTINSYSLRNLRKTVDNIDDSVIESVIRDFYSSYSPDYKNCEISHDVFKKILVEEIFKKQTYGSFESWKVSDAWVECRGGSKCTLEGSFSSKYPKRKIVLHTIFLKDGIQVDPVYADLLDEHLAFNFIAYPFAEEKDEFKISLISKNSYKIELDLLYQEDRLNLDQIDSIVPQEKQTPLFFLSLIDHLENSNIPNNEIREKDYLIEKIIENIIFNLFNEDLLGVVGNSEIDLNNQGEHLIKELFIASCENTYPEYSTLITAKGWEKKINTYKNALTLDSEKLSLLQKRGKEPVHFSDNPKENKKFIAKIFSQTSTNLESWLISMDNLVNFKFTPQESNFSFKIHPLEEHFLALIEREGTERVIDGVLCKSILLDKKILSSLRKNGYLIEEILIILEIGSARKYFNFHREKKLLYTKPEDKHELRESINNFFKAVNDQVSLLDTFDDYTNDTDALNDLRGKIQLIENKEQADKYSNQLKIIQSTNKHYCTKTLQNLLNVDIQKDRGGLADKNNIIEKKLTEIKSNTVAGQVGWVKELVKIQTNIEHELSQTLSQGKNFIEKLKRLTPPNIPENVKVIQLFLDTKQNYSDLQQEVYTNYSIDYENILKNYEAFDKWKAILKKAGDLEKRFAQYSSIPSLADLKDKIDKLNDDVSENLENNRQQTLNNHENYKQSFQTIQNELVNTIQNLKTDWENKKKEYEELIKEFMGHYPNSTVRWSDSPEVSYQDLYNSVISQIESYLKTKEKKVNTLSDDVIYSMEVLNHKKAIQNKKIDEKLKEIKYKIAELLKEDLTTDIKSITFFRSLSQELKTLNNTYIELNRGHLSIIKPISLELESEKNLFSLLDKNNELDLKRLIIEYQKKCTPDSDLSACRDAVLELMKELFLKKQVSISIRKGKV